MQTKVHDRNGLYAESRWVGIGMHSVGDVETKRGMLCCYSQWIWEPDIVVIMAFHSGNGCGLERCFVAVFWGYVKQKGRMWVSKMVVTSLANVVGCECVYDGGGLES